MSLPLMLAAGATSTPSTSTSPTPTPGLPDVSLDGVKAALMDACGNPPGFLCRTVYDSTHSDYLASGAQVFLGTPVTIILILLVATVIRSLLHRLIKRTTRHAASVTGNGGLFRGGLLGAFGDSAILLERRRQRAETVGSLLRSVVSIVVYGIAFILVLGELGINLAPIVASAGVLGIAVGFGAQNLVKDFLSGIFMLLEDQYGVGDVIDVGTISGTVEAVTFRMTRLRDVEGTVWYVRNGEITRIGNKSQQWARTVLDVPLDYDTDVARAKDVLLETTQVMWRDDQWALLIIEEPEVWGMESMTADGYTLRVAVKTLPLKQWDVARELRERLRLALVGAGISLGALQRSLVVVDDDEEAEPSSEEDEEAAPGAPPQFGDDVPPRIDPPAQPGPSPSSGPGAARGGSAT
ncbi:mechanosensitive ion channel family protein [Pseudofrankia sp. BMG5.36]|uniref:mechanosensitive ion channel family protein n=1 Tax=Pseudofrankia sp. BMG5.36 TaxID=1834512 RepID=UPI0009F2DC3B|nr:mechanosensitive ion channel family protein [Pseudofrankia sp. BMG5.36]